MKNLIGLAITAGVALVWYGFASGAIPQFATAILSGFQGKVGL